MSNELLQSIALIIDYIAVVVLVVGFVIILILTIPRAYRAYCHNSSQEFYGVIYFLRRHLGQTLLLALEILIVSDIIFSIVHRTIDEIVILGLTVAIRVLLSYFLNIELDHLERKSDTEDKLK